MSVNELREIFGIQTNGHYVQRRRDFMIIPATEEFIAREKFKEKSHHPFMERSYDDFINPASRDQANIAWLSPNFKRWFLGKTEKPAPELKIGLNHLTGSLDSREILDELGEEYAETTLASLNHIMIQQPDENRGGMLHIGGGPHEFNNLFFIRDADEVLRAVFVSWSRYWFSSRSINDGWQITADTIQRSLPIVYFVHIFSRAHNLSLFPCHLNLSPFRR